MLKKYLNKEIYRENKKTLIVVCLIFIIGIVIGSFFIYFGVTEENILKQLNEEKQVLNKKLISYEISKNEEYLKNGLSEVYYKMNDEINEVRAELKEINSSIAKNNENENINMLFLIGLSSIIISLTIDGILLFHIYQKLNNNCKPNLITEENLLKENDENF